jgi:hypothetical protein
MTVADLDLAALRRTRFCLCSMQALDNSRRLQTCHEALTPRETARYNDLHDYSHATSFLV